MVAQQRDDDLLEGEDIEMETTGDIEDEEDEVSLDDLEDEEEDRATGNRAQTFNPDDDGVDDYFDEKYFDK